jgi:hypothetical protein
LQGAQNVLNLYIIPRAPGRSRALVSIFTDAKATPLLPYLAMKHLDIPWLAHTQRSNRILDGDTAILHWQVSSVCLQFWLQ